MTSSKDKELILVDEHDQPIGTGLKLSVHKDGLLHRAFSIFIFNGKGQLMLQRRALGKYHSGGLWTNTCCGHPRPEETVLGAAHRRLQEEMGFDCALYEVGTLTYRAEVSQGLIEHEFDHVLVGRFDEDVHPNPDEALDWQWVDLDTLHIALKAQPDTFTVWFKTIIEQPGGKLHNLRDLALKLHTE